MNQYPFTPIERKTQNKTKGKLIHAAIFLYFLMAFVCFLLSGVFSVAMIWSTNEAPRLTQFLIVISFALCLFPFGLIFAAFLFWPQLESFYKMGRRLQKTDAITLLEQDKRAPVLFLRSFRDDDLPDVGSGGFWVSTVEETLEKHFSKLGPVVAIGRPGEPYPELGSARFYVSDDEWKIAVEYFLAKSQVVVLLMGATMGVLWEVDRALTTVSPEKLLLCFPFILPQDKRNSWLPRMRHVKNFHFSLDLVQHMRQEREQRYQLFRSHVEEQTQIRLPASPGDTIFIDFMEDGTARLLQSAPPVRALSIYKNRQQSFVALPDYERTLRPFFEKLLHKTISPPLLERFLTNKRALLNSIIGLFVLAGVFLLIPVKELACFKLFCCQGSLFFMVILALYSNKLTGNKPPT